MYVTGVEPYRYTNADLKLSLYVCVHINQYPENFTFLILRILELLARKVKKQANF